MKLSKQQKITRQKLDVLSHPGVLMMLVDFMKEDDKRMKGFTCAKDEVYAKDISEIVAKLKVMYLNEITPVEESKQRTIEDAIEEVYKDKPMWDKLDQMRENEKKSEQSVGFYLSDGSHILCNGEPDDKTVEAIQEMIKLAKKKVK